jgi:hypothetical protein
VKYDETFVVDVIVRKDHANEGLSMADALGMIQDVLPKLTHRQAYNLLKHMMVPNNKYVLKSKLVVAQSTTTKRSGIIIGQKFCWFKYYHGTLGCLQQLNNGDIW